LSFFISHYNYLLPNIAIIPSINAPIATNTIKPTHPGIVAAAAVNVLTANDAFGSADTDALLLILASIKNTTAKVITSVAMPIPSAPKKPT